MMHDSSSISAFRKHFTLTETGFFLTEHIHHLPNAKGSHC